jgi:hypothetical protein
MPKYPLYLMGVRFTEAQHKIIKEFAEARGLERPHDILQALAMEHFPDWPADYPKWGGKREKKK